jgi:hypothetical protein
LNWTRIIKSDKKTMNLELGNKGEPEPPQQNPWYEYNIENNEKNLNEIIVTLRLKKTLQDCLYPCPHA